MNKFNNDMHFAALNKNKNEGSNSKTTLAKFFSFPYISSDNAEIINILNNWFGFKEMQSQSILFTRFSEFFRVAGVSSSEMCFLSNFRFEKNVSIFDCKLLHSNRTIKISLKPEMIYGSGAELDWEESHLRQTYQYYRDENKYGFFLEYYENIANKSLSHYTSDLSYNLYNFASSHQLYSSSGMNFKTNYLTQSINDNGFNENGVLFYMTSTSLPPQQGNPWTPYFDIDTADDYFQLMQTESMESLYHQLMELSKISPEAYERFKLIRSLNNKEKDVYSLYKGKVIRNKPNI